MLGTQVGVPGPATWISYPWRKLIAGLLTCLANLKVFVRFGSGDGAGSVTVEQEVIMGPKGCTIMIDVSKISGNGNPSLLQQFKLKTNSGTLDAGDYWWAKTWDGTTLGGSFVKIAKPYKLRANSTGGGVGGAIVSEAIRGVTYTYSYALDATYLEYRRTTSGSDGSASTDYVTPPALDGDIIYAVPFATSTPTGLSAVTLLAIDERKWATGP